MELWQWRTGDRGRNSDNTLIKELLSWAPSQTLREGMEKTYKWIEEQRRWHHPMTSWQRLAPWRSRRGSLMNKVFNIGLWKTGTKSFGVAMDVLGYKVHSHFWPIETRLDFEEDIELTQDQIDKIKNVSTRFDAFADSPWLNIYKYLYEWYPDAKFVLTLRKYPERIAISAYYHAIAYGSSKLDIQDPMWLMDRYNNHNRNVRDFFKDKSDQLLEICFECGDGWDKLCSFIDAPVPPIPFPHVNKRRQLPRQSPNRTPHT